ncbi:MULTISPECIES: TIGR02265 family protein [Myxococcus]|uniref:TIGR02265 family protein n=1 Tax=Myxococcus llanfairpwllgwyngyllgogerychwyrndrobwllllantysiliogogogochensis TaxID=2590453 RepID=A0A540WK75_9BACT|nr:MULTISPECIES: TIGR02265 family protein [Myxococcus]TQF09416.1 TIGR02265 family protein [Myxococcus llanfairpwllgwyngyllgogerychwyrndrobwllllantysiliogogogochensis]
MDASTHRDEGLEMGEERGGVDPLTELARRLALTTSRDKARGMFFLGVLDVVRRVAGEAARARCLTTSKERRFVPFFLYPINDFLRLSYCAAGLLAPRLGGFDRALETMGAQATRDFLASALGRTLLTAANGSPRRLVEHLPWGYSASVSYGERHVSWESERKGCLHMRRDFMPPPYHQGVLLAVLQTLGARDVRVEGHEPRLLDCDYALAWE